MSASLAAGMGFEASVRLASAYAAAYLESSCDPLADALPARAQVLNRSGSGAVDL